MLNGMNTDLSLTSSGLVVQRSAMKSFGRSNARGSGKTKLEPDTGFGPSNELTSEHRI